MASTARGRALTDAHRRAQVALTARFLAASTLLLGEVSPARIDDTLPDWAGLQVALTENAWGQSRGLASEYLAAYRVAEVGAAGASMPVAATFLFDAQGAALDALWLSPVAKRHIAEGMTGRGALERAFATNVGLSQQRHVLDGGRRYLDESTLANPASTGWRRVSDGNPCEWCALMVARGPVFRTPATAGDGRRWHDRCGCTIEEIFGAWQPTSLEQEWIDAYDAAAQDGGSISAIANRMARQARADT